jgi:hypothetical protein
MEEYSRAGRTQTNASFGHGQGIRLYNNTAAAAAAKFESEGKYVHAGREAMTCGVPSGSRRQGSRDARVFADSSMARADFRCTRLELEASSRPSRPPKQSYAHHSAGRSICVISDTSFGPHRRSNPQKDFGGLDFVDTRSMT